MYIFLFSEELTLSYAFHQHIMSVKVCFGENVHKLVTHSKAIQSFELLLLKILLVHVQIIQVH